MATKDDKWVMFRNYMHNELGITKEDVRIWINEAAAEEAKKIVADSFQRENPEQLIKRAIYDSSVFRNRTFKDEVIRKAGEILAERLEITVKVNNLKISES